MTFTSFSIPSLKDGLSLDGRLHHPEDHKLRAGRELWGAIMAHPYAPLGGSYDDHVVTLATQECLKRGIAVVTFNFRGAPGSQGRTSWTGGSELEDYKSMVALIHIYLRLATGNIQQSTIQASDTSTVSALNIIMGGYSYGSMMAMQSPCSYYTSPRPGPTLPDGQLQAIATVAQNLISKRSNPSKHSDHRWTHISNASNALTNRPDVDSREQVKVSCSRLLISPLLPPISYLLSLSTLLRGSVHESEVVVSRLTTDPTLVVHGAEDEFTSAKKVQIWCDRLQERSAGGFQYHQIDGANHFWRSEGTQTKLSDILGEWIERLVGD